MPVTSNKIAAAKKRQRHVFTFGILASLIPITCQILIAYVIFVDGGDFPRADYSFVTYNFWAAQFLLLCIATASNTLVDFAKFILDKSVNVPNIVTKVLFLFLLLAVASVYFSVAILGSDIITKSFWPLFFFIPGLVILSYVIDMDLALIDMKV